MPVVLCFELSSLSCHCRLNGTYEEEDEDGFVCSPSIRGEAIMSVGSARDCLDFKRKELKKEPYGFVAGQLQRRAPWCLPSGLLAASALTTYFGLAHPLIFFYLDCLPACDLPPLSASTSTSSLRESLYNSTRSENSQHVSFASNDNECKRRGFGARRQELAGPPCRTKVQGKPRYRDEQD